VKFPERVSDKLAAGPPFSGRPLGGPRLLGGFIWVLFIVFPVLNALGSGGKPHNHGLVVGGAILFVAAYVWLVLSWRWRTKLEERAVVLFVIMLAVAAALTAFQDPGWGFLFTYCAACAGLIGSSSAGFLAVILCSGLAAACTLLGNGSAGAALGFAASSAGIGLLMRLMRDLRTRNRELTEARAELAQLAVAQERERFARDLHDLLGHTMSVIALKAELAGRLLHDRPEQAAKEVADVESVARQALGEVREAVSGYRQPTLDGELEGARMALSAAGIETSVQRPEVSIDPAAEAVLAWAVREGATNVIRHSGATRCAMKISAGLGTTTLEVVDDGGGARGSGSGPDGSGSSDAGPGSANGRGSGHGLAGLAERARTVAGRVEAGRLPQGGFRLEVRVPSGGTPLGAR
jgi:two-component system, NarL family, sensor histidine kinase DesK